MSAVESPEQEKSVEKIHDKSIEHENVIVQEIEEKQDLKEPLIQCLRSKTPSVNSDAPNDDLKNDSSFHQGPDSIIEIPNPNTLSQKVDRPKKDEESRFFGSPLFYTCLLGAGVVIGLTLFRKKLF